MDILPEVGMEEKQSNSKKSNQVNTYQRYGELLGYPHCCVKSFERRSRRILSSVTPVGYRKRLSYNGFMPCRFHSKLSFIEICELIGHDPYDESFERMTIGTCNWWSYIFCCIYEADMVLSYILLVEDFYEEIYYW